MTLDPQSKPQVRKLIEMADAKFRLSAKAGESLSGNCDGATFKRLQDRELRRADEGCELLKPLGIKCEFPGLYPVFYVKGYEETTAEMAVLSALGHPRNWLRDEEDSHE